MEAKVQYEAPSVQVLLLGTMDSVMIIPGSPVLQEGEFYFPGYGESIEL